MMLAISMHNLVIGWGASGLSLTGGGAVEAGAGLEQAIATSPLANVFKAVIWGESPLVTWVLCLLIGVVGFVLIALWRQRLSRWSALATILASLLLALAFLNPQRVTESRQPLPTLLAVMGQGNEVQQQAIKGWSDHQPALEVQQAA
ncbi:MAG: hypothetical protein FJX22_01125, partial [Alphaproteobacteria bacterium]|nr:hypothetical protein [Alphaproteobacteria bacterium]